MKIRPYESASAIAETPSSEPSEFRLETIPQVLSELQGENDNPELYATVLNSLQNVLDRIAIKIEQHQIDPSVLAKIRLSNEDRQKRGVAERIHEQVRVGVFPVAANPIHWGQLIVALEAVAQRNLSGVIFILQGPGDVDKPEIEETLAERRQMAEAVLSKFGGLFQTSTISYETHGRGEKTVFDLIGQNQELVDPQEAANHEAGVTWAYMAGSDHQHIWKEPVIKEHLTDPGFFNRPLNTYDFNKELDTIGKMYRLVTQRGQQLKSIGQWIELVFNNRPGFTVYSYMAEADAMRLANENFKFEGFDGQKFAASSTEIRKRIKGVESPEAAVTLPRSVAALIDSPAFDRYRSVIG